MAEVHTPLWSADQQHLLRAMGYQLLQRITAGQTSGPVADTHGDRDEHRAANGKHESPSSPADSAAAALDGKSQAMLLAVLRAAGCGVDDGAANESVRQALALLPVNIHQLLSDPAARKALWPHLRRYRRQGAGVRR